MIEIKKSPAPAALIQAKRLGLTDYSEMDTATKDAIKLSLFQEQYHLCAYCMRRLNPETMQIEHYLAQHPEDGADDPALTIDYQNMLGGCPGGKGEVQHGEQLTCDQHRGNTPLTVNPLRPATLAKITYSSSGEIRSDDPDIMKDLDKTLNLNCSASRLVKNRKAALDALKRKIQQTYRGRTVPKEKWMEMLSHYEAGNEKGEKVEYVGILIDYLRRKTNT